MNEQQKSEWLIAAEDAALFIHDYCMIYDGKTRRWIPFDLWPMQGQVIDQLDSHQMNVILKARQMGLTWVCIGFALWLMIFYPIQTILLFSRRDEEAVELLDFRLKGMYRRLPKWMQTREVKTSNAHEFKLSNESRALAFPTTGGRSYTGTFALVDEADFVLDLGALINAVEPTIEAGGQMILLSTADKNTPESEFKRLFRAAEAGENSWNAIFLPWFARPDRTEGWYEQRKRNSIARTGSLDDLRQEYPTTAQEALAPRTLDKRLAFDWFGTQFIERKGLTDDALVLAGGPAINGLVVYRLPQPNHRYVIGIDPAEGNPTSDDSALSVVDADSGEEVARLAGKIQPEVLAAYANEIGLWYNRAAAMVERNNHGHTVILWLKDNGNLTLLTGHDGKIGWLSSSKGKAILYDSVATAYRKKKRILHSSETLNQLLSIEGSTLRAPKGQRDDLADADALATVAMMQRRYKGTQTNYMTGEGYG